MVLSQDLRAHIGLLDDQQKLHRIAAAVNKDTQLMPLVRWQFRGLGENDRRAFLFENVTDSRGRTFTGSVAVGIYAASTDVYSLGMGCPPHKIRERWMEAQLRPIPPRIVDTGPAQEEVHMGDSFLEHGGIEEFPIPNSTPGFDIAPYTTASNWITKDPESGWINVGNYRGQIKGPDRIGMFISPRKHAWKHWDIARKKGQRFEAALVIGGPPAVTFTSGSRIPYGIEEYAIAGGLIGQPIDLVRCKTIDLLVPAYAEIVIEGFISTEYIEPEAPFGEYTGYMGSRVYNAVFEATAITHRKNPITTAIISQMPPSESSKMKKIAHDYNYLHYLRNQCNLPDVLDVSVGEIAVDSWSVIRMRRCNPSVTWQALYAFAGRNTNVGKLVVAVDEDIDPNDMESVLWALSYRMQPEQDMRILTHRSVSLDPSGIPPSSVIADNTVQKNYGSLCLINAMRKWDYPPVSLPAKPYMERAKELWEQLGLPSLTPRVPWFGYELGDWSNRDREEAAWAVRGEYHLTGKRAEEERKKL